MKLKLGKFSYCILAVSFSILCSLTSCREPFEPNITTNSQQLLIVEGNINSGAGSTVIKLARSQALKDILQTNIENRAIVTVEGEDASKYQLTNLQTGDYSSPQLNLNSQIRYRLHIICSVDEEYVSDYTVPIKTPAIDSLSWAHDAQGVHIFADTHDSKNQLNFYRYNFEETWEIHSIGYSLIKYLGFNNDGSIDYTLRDYQSKDSLFFCWRNNLSSSIILGTSAQLKNSVISHLPITIVPQDDEKIGVRYSILVKQYAQTLSAYQYYLNLQRNSELTGSIFSSQPSNLFGNIHSIKGNKSVIGFIEASDEQVKRIFITKQDVGEIANNWRYKSACYIQKIANKKDTLLNWFPAPAFLIQPNARPGTPIIETYSITTPECGDCQLRGTPEKPSYW